MLKIKSYSTGMRNLWNKNFTDSYFDNKSLEEVYDDIFEIISKENNHSTKEVFIDTDRYMCRGYEDCLLRINKDDLSIIGCCTELEGFLRVADDYQRFENVRSDIANIIYLVFSRRMDINTGINKIKGILGRDLISINSLHINSFVRFMAPNSYSNYVLLSYT